MPGTLFVVATPIGNLEDITLRALRVLREADLIAAEDTRRTARLLARHAISTPTVSFHQHNTRTALPKLISRLEESKAVALVTDAGTPGISDPGVELVRACIERGIPVEPIPGVSAALTAAVASGFPLIPLTIAGFPPYKSKDRTRWFQALSEIQWTITFFEAPHRIQATLRTASEILGNSPMQMLVTGGGALNLHLASRLKMEMSHQKIDVVIPEKTLINFKEALVMALIGIMRWRDEPNTMSTVTGATSDSVNGAVYMGRN